MTLAWSNAVSIDQTTDGTTNRVFVGNFPATFAADGVKVTGAPALGAGGSGAIGWYSQIDNDIQTLNITGGQGNSNTFGILSRMTDGTHLTRAIAAVKTTADATIADGTQTQKRMDGHGRMRFTNNNVVDPWNTYVKLYGSINTASVADVQITNANSAGGNYPVNAITRTVTTGKTLYLKKIMLSVEGLINDEGVFSISIGGVKEFFFAMKTGSSNNGTGPNCYSEDFGEGYPIPAGTVIAIYFRTVNGGALTGWMRLDGKEEIN